MALPKMLSENSTHINILLKYTRILARSVLLKSLTVLTVTTLMVPSSDDCLDFVTIFTLGPVFY